MIGSVARKHPVVNFTSVFFLSTSVILSRQHIVSTNRYMWHLSIQHNKEYSFPIVAACGTSLLPIINQPYLHQWSALKMANQFWPAHKHILYYFSNLKLISTDYSSTTCWFVHIETIGVAVNHDVYKYRCIFTVSVLAVFWPLQSWPLQSLISNCYLDWQYTLLSQFLISVIFTLSNCH